MTPILILTTLLALCWHDYRNKTRGHERWSIRDFSSSMVLALEQRLAEFCRFLRQLVTSTLSMVFRLWMYQTLVITHGFDTSRSILYCSWQLSAEEHSFAMNNTKGMIRSEVRMDHILFISGLAAIFQLFAVHDSLADVLRFVSILPTSSMAPSASMTSSATPTLMDDPAVLSWKALSTELLLRCWYSFRVSSTRVDKESIRI